jgi:hypothetical protein
MNGNEEQMRLAVVADLLAMNGSLDEVVQKLAAFAWDYDGDGVELTKQHLASVIKRYAEGKISAAEVEKWANYIEGRDDVLIDTDAERDIEGVLHELANPYLTQSLTHTRVAQLLAVLNATT